MALSPIPITLLITQPAAAQTIEEIVVTTRKREENLQDVPIAVDVISGDFIERAGIRDLRSIASLDPSLSVNEFFSQNDTRVTIRGLTNTRGRSNVAFLVDRIDVTTEALGNSGTPVLTNQRLLNDLERVEVVKGPQSALYGRAAFAGALSYITKDPTDEFEVISTLDINDQDEYEVGGVLNIPLSDNFAMRLNAVHWDADGWYENEATGNNLGGGDGTGGAITFLYTPTDELKIKLRTSYSSDDYEQRATARLPESRATTFDVPQYPELDLDDTIQIITKIGDADGLVVEASENPRTGNDYAGTSTDILRASLNVEWELDKWLFSSITGVTDAETDQFWDLDRQADGRPDTILAHAEVNSVQDTNQFSQEFRFASNWDGALQMTLGGLYWTEDRENNDNSITAVCFVSSLCARDGLSGWQDIILEVDRDNAANDWQGIDSEADTDHWSLYALVSLDFAEQWRFTVENRYVNEKFTRTREKGSSCAIFYTSKLTDDSLILDLDGDFSCANGPVEEGTVRSAFNTPKFTLEYMPTDNLMVYLSAAKAQKPGGIAGGGAPGPFAADFESSFFKPEKLWAYELGAKSSWSGDFGALTLNGAVFYQDYTDKQIAVRTEVDGFLVARIENASAASVAGLELQTQWATPLEGLSIGLAYTYLDAEYDDFTDLTTDERRIVAAGGCDDIVELGGTQNCLVNLSGNQMELAPEHAFSGLINLTRPIGNRGLEWYAETEAQWQDERYTSENNEALLDSYWLANARVGLTSERWSTTIYVDNVFDDDTLLNWGNSPDFGAVAVDAGFPNFFNVMEISTLPQPRTVGLRLKATF
jgi:outer membrane receptor protein involved in Fe transport